MLVTASQKAATRLKAKIKEMSDRKRFRDKPLFKFTALNAVLRGWLMYFRHCNAKETAKDLDFWVNERLFRWLQKRHRLPPLKIIALYKQRENGTRDNWGIRNGETMRNLYRMSDQPITKYRSRNPPNPYIEGEWVTTLNLAEAPQPEFVWLGNAQNNEEWRELKEEIKAERGAKCGLCGSTENLDRHHQKARRYGGKAVKENLQLLCRSCHAKTATFGDQSRLQ